jgi:hypothetical protein
MEIKFMHELGTPYRPGSKLPKPVEQLTPQTQAQERAEITTYCAGLDLKSAAARHQKFCLERDFSQRHEIITASDSTARNISQCPSLAPSGFDFPASGITISH